MRDITPMGPFDSHGDQPASGELITTPPLMQKVMRVYLMGFSVRSRPTIKSALSQAADALGWKNIGGHLDQMPWHTITADDLVNLKAGWEGLIEPSTISLYMHAVRGIAQACLVHGLMSSDQYVLLKFIKVPRATNEVGRGRAVERKYRDALMRDCLSDEKRQGVRDAAIIALLFGSGIRRSEAAGLTDQKIDLDEGEIKITAKGGKVVIRHIAAWAIPFIAEWRAVRRSEGLHKGAFFNRISKSGKVSEKGMSDRGVYYVLEQRSIRAGLPYLVKPHDARRTMGTDMIQEHGELIAQKVLGHASLSTTKIYDKRSDSVLKDIFKAKDH